MPGPPCGVLDSRETKENSTMIQQHWVPLLIAFGLTLSNQEGSGPTPAPSGELAKLARARLETARRTFEGFWSAKEWRDVEIPYRWSRRWLDAQCRVNDRREDQVAAFRQHLDRMRELEQLTRQAFRVRLVGIEFVHAAEYYVAEAAEWLAHAQAGGQKSVKNR